MKKSRIKSVVLAITYHCNLKCQMCNIWQIKNPQEINLDYLNNLKNLKYVNLSGGEPFLNPNLELIIQKIKKNNPRSKIIISSNGYNSKKIINTSKKILKIDPQIGIRISLDGIGDLHNKIRGLKNAYQNAIQSILDLKKLGLKNLGIAFTLMPDNFKQIEQIYKLSQKLNIEFSISSIQNSELYFNKIDNNLKFNNQIKKQLRSIIKKELKTWNFKKWLRAYFMYGLSYYIENKKRLIPSDAGEYSVFIDADSNIYPSNLVNKKIGNLQKGDLSQINFKNKAINDHWTICTLRGSMKKYWFKILFWIFINKIKNLV